MSKELKEVMHLALKGGRNSVAVETAKFFAGMGRSAFIYNLNVRSGGVLYPSMNQYFNEPHKSENVRDPELSEVPVLLTNIRERIEGNRGVPENFLGVKSAAEFQAAKKAIELNFRSGEILEDLVAMDPNSDCHVLFYRQMGNLKPLYIRDSVLDNEVIQNQLADNSVAVELPGNKKDLEIAAQTILVRSGRDFDEHKLRELNSTANSLPSKRHVLFEPGGDVVWELTQKQIYSTQELIDLLQFYGLYAAKLNSNGEVEIDPELRDIAARICDLSGVLDPRRAKAELERFAREGVYYGLTKEYFSEHPGILMDFVKSKEFDSIKEEFKDAFVNSYGYTEMQLAQEILSNYLLVNFENPTSAKDSNYISFLKDPDKFMKTVGQFALDNGQMFNVSQGVGSSPDAIKLLSNKLTRNPFSGIDRFKKTAKFIRWKRGIIEGAENSLVSAKEEITRQEDGKKIVDIAASVLGIGLVDNASGNLRPNRQIISNLVFVKTPDKKSYTISRALTFRGSYFPEDGLPKEFEKTEVRFNSLEEIVKYVFNGQSELGIVSDTQEAYELQKAKIQETGYQILEFLLTDTRVGDRSWDYYYSTVNTEELAKDTIEHFGDIWNQDPRVPNIFNTRTGFKGYRDQLTHLMVNDFLHAVETNLIRLTNPKRLAARAIERNWKNNDFSNVSPEVVAQAVALTLTETETRTGDLQDKKSAKGKYLKHVVEKLELMFGWDALETKFLRYYYGSDLKQNRGPGNNCGCDYRKIAHNIHVIPTY